MNFTEIRARAADRKGGDDVLMSLMPEAIEITADYTDDRALSQIARCIFRAGFVWRVVEQKWPGFEEAFLGFDPNALLFQPEEFWDELTRNKAIVRHHAKILAMRDNAGFVKEIATEHGNFRDFLQNWPDEDITGLWALLAKRGKRLGGMTGKYFVRFSGKDCFLPSKDVVVCLRDAGLDVAANPTSKGDMKRIEAQFNIWAIETGLSRVQLSRICAMSVGENFDPEVVEENSTAYQG